MRPCEMCWRANVNLDPKERLCDNHYLAGFVSDLLEEIKAAGRGDTPLCDDAREALEAVEEMM